MAALLWLTRRSSRPSTAGFARFRRRLSLNVGHHSSIMNSIELPYAEGRRTDALLFASIALAGLVGIYKPPAAAGFLAALAILIAVLGLLKTFLAPRLVTIDSVTGIATFSPLSLPVRRFYRPISIRNYSSVYGQMNRKASFVSYYSVELSNHKGESVLILSKVPKSQAEKACTSISSQFGLTNRGLV